MCLRRKGCVCVYWYRSFGNALYYAGDDDGGGGLGEFAFMPRLGIFTRVVIILIMTVGRNAFVPVGINISYR